MSGKTSIEWVISPDGSQGHTVNPIRFRNLETGKIGHHCEKISAGCANCYASAMQKPYLSGLEFIATNRERGEFFFDESVLDQVRRRRAPTTFFWCDMTDLFGDWVPGEWIDRCWAVMLDTPQHRHIVLTKRARRLQDHLTSDALAGRAHYHNPPDWIILGVSCEDQAAADERIPHLLATPAACRMVSLEPLLGPIDLYHYHLDWVIVGGESGPGARPMHPGWARSLRDQCWESATPFFFKQWGEWAPSEFGKDSVIVPGLVPDDSVGPDRCHWLWPDGAHFPVGVGVCGMPIPDPEVLTLRVGKKAAGRQLDGRVWDERPEVLR